MNRRTAVTILVLLFTVLPAIAAGPDDLDRLLTFEGSASGAAPAGWSGGPPETLFADGDVVHGGSWSGRIERTSGSPGAFSSLTTRIPMDFAGAAIELHGFLRTENVTGWAGLWMREDGESGSVAFDNMQSRALRGTTEWTEYTIRLPIDKAGVTLFFGALLAGEGKVWVDDLRLLVDGKPLQAVPRVEKPQTVLDTDREFDAGSKVTIDTLTPDQTANLATLGKVWGFLKYHHPKVVAGDVHWDFELFRVLPHVLAAADRAGAQQAILAWTRKLGDVAACDPCATLPDGLALRPDLDWIHDRAALGQPLAAFLEHVYRNRHRRTDQAYVALVPDVGNPEFRREKGYGQPAWPDSGYRILALFRFWSVVQYWSPYRDAIGADWNAILPEFLPRLVGAKDLDTYRTELFALISRLNDGHANLWSVAAMRPPRGDCQIPVFLRYVEGQAVVAGYTHAESGPSTGLRVGDVVRTLDGVPVDRLMTSWKPYYSASNDVHRAAAMMHALTQGTCGPVQVVAERAGAPLEIATERRPNRELDLQAGRTHDLPGAAFRRLSPDVAYLKLSAVKIAEIPDYLRGAAGTKGWIIDIRNYPSEFVVFALGGHFVAEPTPFARFTYGDPANPGSFRWTDPPLVLPPIAPHYPGKTVILVDETSMSNAEYTAMALRAAPNSLVVGSTTAGADGNVSPVPLPGGLTSPISGIGVFYPDKKPTQRIGIVPNVEAHPTIDGIREGRDEVLEAALRQILGTDTPEERIRELAQQGYR